MKPLMLVLVLLTAGLGMARAQAASPRDIQNLIASGQPQAALSELNSGIAWYLDAEAQDATGNESAARAALANAEQNAPGLPFAKPADVAALRAHLAPSSKGGFSMSPVMIILGLIVLYVLFRLFRRRPAFYPQRYGNVPPPGYGQAGYGQPGYGPPGGGLGSSLLGGLAAGAGFAAGERIIDDMAGRDQGPVDDAWGASPTPDRDDGLSGSPGWDSGSTDDNSGGGFDSGNDW
jgi:hypothetical protein